MGQADKQQLVVRQTDALTQRLADDSSEVQALRAAIEETRAKISRSIQDIQVNVEETLDWRRWVRENPWKAVGIAAMVGFYFGS